jgi:hypothetical protein
MVVAIWLLAFGFQLAVGAHSSDSARLSVANPTVGPYRWQAANSSIAADDEGADPTTQEECVDMGRRFPADVLVAMTMEELKYLESTLCPSASGADPSGVPQ